ncbi:glycosyltransferase family 2 protein [Virgibacillus sp. NKC19-16]|uniref:glycosyltransferase n=1 Tax=Virgibacillus salidurans TaxID=2831673 RepID=UPI001F3EB045|nr:glycosyltransferase family 2 protein [Virgibacillus sp. NKC19-16]UJL46159.1 glycosyltransferase family 2 protein [Virgibacillus sp. NKC19-16]
MLTWLLTISVIIIVIGWLSGYLMLWKVPHLGGKSTNVSADSFVSVIVPARNEQARLKPLLDSIVKQNWRNYEIIVVDDDSTDETVLVADAYDAVTIIENRTLEEGWIGKLAACWSGAKMARGNYLLFLDADTRFKKEDSLHRLIAAYQDVGGRGILSLQPYHTIKHSYENLSSIFNIIVMAGMNVFTPLGNKLKSAGSFGPCILTSKEDYFAAGGHEKIRGAVMDDFALGEAMEKMGLPVRCYGGRGLIDFQMYPEGIRQLVEGWTKNFATASQSTHPLVMTLIICWISGGFVAIPLLITVIITDSLFWSIIGMIGYLGYMIQFFLLARRTGNFHFIPFLVFPFLLLFFTILFAWSFFLTNVRHSVRWRDRNIKV